MKHRPKLTWKTFNYFGVLAVVASIAVVVIVCLVCSSCVTVNKEINIFVVEPVVQVELNNRNQ